MHRRQLFHQTDRNIDSSAIANTKRWVNDLFLQISIQAAVRNDKSNDDQSNDKSNHKCGIQSIPTSGISMVWYYDACYGKRWP